MGRQKVKENIGERRFKALIENAYEGIVVYDANGFIQYASPSVKKLGGYNAGELVGKRGFKFLHSQDVESGRNVFREVINRPGKSITFFHRVRHRKGHYFWVESRLTNFLHQPEVNGIVSNFRDIQTQKTAEQDAFEAHRLLETINRNLTEGIFMGVISKEFLYANDAFLKMMDVPSFNSLRRIKPFEFYADKKQHQHILKILKDNDVVRNEEVLFIKRNGEKFWARISLSKITFQGNPNCFVGNVQDITRQKQTEQELINSRNFLQNVINTVAAPIFVKDRKHRWILFNDAFRRGRNATFLLRKTDHDILPQKLSDQIWKVDNEVIRTGRTITREEIIPDHQGNYQTVLTTKSLYVDDKGEKFIIGVLIDITERKRFEEIIKSMNAGLRAVLESTKDQILALDKSYCYTMFNRSHAHNLKNLSGEEIKIGDNYLSVLPQDLSRRAMREIRRAFTGEHFTSEVIAPNKSVVETTYNVIQDDKGKITGVALFIKDITDRKITEAKLKALNDELTLQNRTLATREAELKMAMEELSDRNFELDQLMYKTSHDLRSPLSSIMGLVNLARLDRDAQNREEYITKIEGRIKKLDDFIRSMLNYARVNRGEMSIEVIDLEKVANTAIRELEYLENFKSLRTKITIENKEIPFRNDPLRVNIIFSNIISNAYKYLNPERTSYLKIKIKISPESTIVEFKDNGIGIKKEYMDKIFNMFYRATDRSEGSGLGMYIVKQAIDKAGGQIKVKSNYGKGTVIKVKLPNL